MPRCGVMLKVTGRVAAAGGARSLAAGRGAGALRGDAEAAEDCGI